MISVIVHEEAALLGIVNPVACFIEGITVTENSHQLDEEINRLMQNLSQEGPSILSRPEVRGFNDLFARVGYPQQVPAGQRLIELLQQRGFRRYNNVVDAYNISTALSGSGLGMHDASSITDDIHVSRARGDEQILPLFKTKEVKVASGDIIYSHAQTGGSSGQVMAWLGKRDVDSDRFKVTEATKQLLLVVLGNEATSQDYNREVCLQTVKLIRRTCPTANLSFLSVIRSKAMCTNPLSTA